MLYVYKCDQNKAYLAQEIIDVSMVLSDALNELVEVLNETTDLGERSTLDMRL